MNEEFFTELALCAHDPLRYAYWAYPWGQAGTELAHADGPDTWQRELFSYIGDQLKSGQKVIRVAVKSGHGVGKSAVSSMLIDWAMSTHEGTRGVVTAHTERQLRTKTWVELSKWRRLSITAPLFTTGATSIVTTDPALEREWRFDMVPWSKENTEAFAGLHNQGKRIILIIDEAAGIPDIIFEVAENALTDKDTEIIWVVFGNPTQKTGRFFELFDEGKFAKNWHNITVDSRASKLTNKEVLNQMVEAYGIDSDIVRKRILGLFPRSDDISFFSRELLELALSRELPYKNTAPVVLGVDPARYGADDAVIFPRQGFDARSRRVRKYNKLSTVELAEKVSEAFYEEEADAIFVDVTGLGAGVVDVLRHSGLPVYEVNFSSAPSNPVAATGHSPGNKRAEIYCALAEWMKHGALQDVVIDGADHNMTDEFLATSFYYAPKTQKLMMESKQEVRAREGYSPNFVDALATTFAFPYLVVEKQNKEHNAPVTTVRYNPYARKFQ